MPPISSGADFDLTHERFKEEPTLDNWRQSIKSPNNAAISCDPLPAPPKPRAKRQLQEAGTENREPRTKSPSPNANSPFQHSTNRPFLSLPLCALCVSVVIPIPEHFQARRIQASFQIATSNKSPALTLRTENREPKTENREPRTENREPPPPNC
jgi:hypothetical protein